MISLTKHHGLGNDFLIAIEPEISLTADDAVHWCNRHLGVGADGLIVATKAPGDTEADWSMVLYNADGSRAEISGNGIRCLGQALADHAGLGATTMRIATDAGLRQLEIQPAEGDTRQVRVDMGAAKPGPGDFDRWDSTGVSPIRQASVDMGNPHLVALVDDPAAVDLAAVRPVVEASYRAASTCISLKLIGPTICRSMYGNEGRESPMPVARALVPPRLLLPTGDWRMERSPFKCLEVEAVVEVTDTVHLTGPATYHIASLSVFPWLRQTRLGSRTRRQP
ncbi:MAG: diaminopimelate epimerase [Acidimicrobiales bacterium]